jgi:putative hydrolase of the HAD superfamily
MAEVSLLLWDIGGVLLTNAWDRDDREAAAVRFGLDATEFERRHDALADDLESGRLDFDAYLGATVFDRPRPFSPAEFVAFVRDRSRPHPAALATARALRAGGRYAMIALNNESRALNEYRIATFRLTEIFDAFLSSCYTGRRKPAPAAYEYALEVTQRAPNEALFLDDRRENVDAAARIGLRTLQVGDPERLAEALALEGIGAG